MDNNDNQYTIHINVDNTKSEPKEYRKLYKLQKEITKSTKSKKSTTSTKQLINDNTQNMMKQNIINNDIDIDNINNINNSAKHRNKLSLYVKIRRKKHKIGMRSRREISHNSLVSLFC